MSAGGDTANDRSRAHDQWERYVFMRDSGHLQFVEKAYRCMRYFEGLQWELADLEKLKLQQRPALTINKIISTISTVMGEQIFNRMEVSFSSKNGAPPEMGDNLNRLWAHDADANQLPWVRSDVFADGVITSRGFYDVRPSFKNNLRGEVEIAKLNPKNVLIDPDAEDYDPDLWEDVIVTKWQSPISIEVNYGKEFAKELEARSMSTYMYGFDSIERKRDRFAVEEFTTAYISDTIRRQRRYIRVLDRQYREPKRVKFFVDPVNGDAREIPSTWDRDRIGKVMQTYDLRVMDKVVNKVRWRVTADDIVLHDDWSPLEHFTVVGYFPYFIHGHTIGLVENLLSSQELLNKASSQELHIVNTTANSGYKVKTGALKNMSIGELENRGAETGIVLELDDIKNLEKLQPNTIPTGLERISYKAEENIKTISNVSDYMTGQVREDVAAKATETNRAAGSTSLAKCTDNLERTDWILARNTLSIWQRYYTEPRMVRATNDTAGADPQDIRFNAVVDGQIVNDLTVGEFSIKVISAPYRALLEDSQFDQAMRLKEVGVAVPDSVLITNSRLVGKTDLIKQLKAQADSPEAKAAAQRKVRAEEASIGAMEAKTMTDTARAKLDVAKAQKEEGSDGAAAAEAANERAKIEQEASLKRYQIDEEMKLKRYQVEEEMKLKRETAQAEAEARRIEAASKPAPQAAQ